MSRIGTSGDKVLSLFEPFDDEWKSATRSIRIDGTVTSVRLENFYWRILAEIAEQLGMQVPQVMTYLAKAAKSGETQHTNFTSFVRVCCGRYLDRRNEGANAQSESNEASGDAAKLQLVEDNAGDQTSADSGQSEKSAQERATVDDVTSSDDAG